MRVRVCARVCVCARERVRARARSLMATLPGGGPAEDGSELRSHARSVAKVGERHTRHKGQIGRGKRQQPRAKQYLAQGGAGVPAPYQFSL